MNKMPVLSTEDLPTSGQKADIPDDDAASQVVQESQDDESTAVYTTAGTRWRPKPNQILQPPVRRGRMPKMSLASLVEPNEPTRSHGNGSGNGNSLSHSHFSRKQAVVKGADPAGSASDSFHGRFHRNPRVYPAMPFQYAPLQQNSERAVSPISSASSAYGDAYTYAAVPQYAGPQYPYAVGAVPYHQYTENTATMPTSFGDTLESHGNGNGSSGGGYAGDPLSKLSIKSLTNLASYPNPNQVRAQQLLFRVRPFFQGLMSNALGQYPHDGKSSMPGSAYTPSIFSGRDIATTPLRPVAPPFSRSIASVSGNMPSMLGIPPLPPSMQMPSSVGMVPPYGATAETMAGVEPSAAGTQTGTMVPTQQHAARESHLGAAASAIQGSVRAQTLPRSMGTHARTAHNYLAYLERKERGVSRFLRPITPAITLLQNCKRLSVGSTPFRSLERVDVGLRRSNSTEQLEKVLPVAVQKEEEEEEEKNTKEGNTFQKPVIRRASSVTIEGSAPVRETPGFTTTTSSPFSTSVRKVETPHMFMSSHDVVTSSFEAMKAPAVCSPTLNIPENNCINDSSQSVWINVEEYFPSYDRVQFQEVDERWPHINPDIVHYGPPGLPSAVHFVETLGEFASSFSVARTIELEARSHFIDQEWYGSTDRLGKTMDEKVAEMEECMRNWETQGLRRPSGGRCEYREIPTSATQRHSVAEYAEPLMCMLYETLIRHRLLSMHKRERWKAMAAKRETRVAPIGKEMKAARRRKKT